MRCPNCGFEYAKGSVFCPQCGIRNADTNAVKKVSLRCCGCGGTLTIDDDKTVLACPFCGNKELILDSDIVKIERIRTKAKKAIELEKIKQIDRLYEQDAERAIEQEQKKQVEDFKNGFLFRALLFCFIGAACLAFYCIASKRIFAGVIAIIQALCFAVSWAMGMRIIQEKKRYIHILVAVFGILLILPIIRSYSVISVPHSKATSSNWDVLVLEKEIPKPNYKGFEIKENTEEKLNIIVRPIDDEAYYQYIADCKDYGFNNNVQESSSGYSAFNDSGYNITLSHGGTNKEMTIEVARLEMLKWKEHSLLSSLPEPPSLYGTIENDNGESIHVILDYMSKDDYSSYCDQCRDQGFKIDDEKYTNSYKAHNESGYCLQTTYFEDERQMRLTLESPVVFKPITWPIIGVGTLAPIPKSLSGNVANDYDWAYTVYIEDMTIEDFDDYVRQCIEAGFDQDTSNYGTAFFADYSEDISIGVSYEGYNIVQIRVTGSVNKDYSNLKRQD